MRIAQLTPGAGGVFYCENCLRDGAIVRAMGNAGHDVTLVPMYLPTGIESTTPDKKDRVFFGGINVYLQQKLSLFRHTPRWIDRLFDSHRLLKWAASKASMTSSPDLADTTISMLKGPHGRQSKELDRLIDWLKLPDNHPDVVVLSNVMLIGLAEPIKKHLDAKVVCLLQDEADFLDGLGDDGASRAWRIISGKCTDVDCFISVSNYYARVMQERLKLPEGLIRVVYTGIDLDGYDSVSNAGAAPAIGFLSQTCSAKGLDVLVEAFINLKCKPSFDDLRLKIAGGHSASDNEFLSGIKDRLDFAGLSDSVDFLESFERSSKLDFFASISVLSVPEKNPPAYGLYVIEANAAAVPVVQPAIGVFEELIEITGGGKVYSPNTPQALTMQLEKFLTDPNKARQIGISARTKVYENFDINQSAKQLAEICKQL